MTRLLVIGGSLRSGSYTTALARSASTLAPAGVEATIYDGLGALPHYDADLDTQDPPASVHHLRAHIAAADGLLLVTPEYNGSIPGVLKNAIDWASRPPGAASVLWSKPVALVAASPGAYGALWAQNDLRRVLGIAGARVVEGELAIPRVHELLGGDGSIADDALRARLLARVESLVAEAGPVARAA